MSAPQSSPIPAPDRVRLEAMSACQLRCADCPTARGEIRPAVKSGFLRADDLARFLDENPSVARVELSNWGEIFLNPELERVLQVGFERDVALACGNGANLNTVTAEQLDAVVRYRLRDLRVSIDGVSDDVYRTYRVRGHLPTVLDNVRAINRRKRAARTVFPRLTWQFIVFGHNEHQLEAAQQLAADLDMRFDAKLAWNDTHSPVKDPERVERLIGKPATRGLFRQREGTDYTRPCRQLWLTPQINFDGTVLGCCDNHWQAFGGNAFSSSLEDAVNEPVIATARAMLRGEIEAQPDIPCTRCETYLRMAEAQDWVSDDELSAGHARHTRERLALRFPATYRLARDLARRTGARSLAHRVRARLP